jgi:hypothetical protein
MTGAVSIGMPPVRAPPTCADTTVDGISSGPVRAWRAALSCANIAAARIGADAELADVGTGGPPTLSFGFSEFDRIRTASPISTNAMTNP